MLIMYICILLILEKTNKDRCLKPVVIKIPHTVCSNFNGKYVNLKLRK